MTPEEGKGLTEKTVRALDRQYARQSEWFYGVRSRLLRRVGIRRKHRVLDVGCGTGLATEELGRRCRGEVVAVDVSPETLAAERDRFTGTSALVARGERLPFADGAFDLVFTQMLFLWLPDPVAVAAEVRRVLKAGSELIVAAEPDFGGRIEHPEETALGPPMANALRRLGADPEIARKLPDLLRRAGFEVEAGVHPSLPQPDELAEAWPQEQEFLASLGDQSPDTCGGCSFLFMPYFWFLARKPR